MHSSTVIDPETAAKIAELSGWHSAANIAWKVAGDSYERRSVVKRTLSQLAKAGVIEAIYVEHCNDPLLCYRIEPHRITALLEDGRR
jgi:hypothetical protein